MAKIFVTRPIPEAGIKMLHDKNYDIFVNEAALDRPAAKEEMLGGVNVADALLSTLTDKIDAEIMDAGLPTLKIIANFAVGFDNVDLEAAKQRNILVSNTPGVLTNTVAEHAVRGFGMKVLYTDVKPSPEFEKEYGAVFVEKLEELLPQCDFVSIHVPLLDSTRHLFNEERLKMMKPTAYLINTSRGAVIDEKALAEALAGGVIKGAAIDVFEFEPAIAPELKQLENVIITPHIASATEETRNKMAELAALNIIEALEGRTPPNLIK